MTTVELTVATPVLELASWTGTLTGATAGSPFASSSITSRAGYSPPSAGSVEGIAWTTTLVGMGP